MTPDARSAAPRTVGLPRQARAFAARTRRSSARASCRALVSRVSSIPKCRRTSFRSSAARPATHSSATTIALTSRVLTHLWVAAVRVTLLVGRGGEVLNGAAQFIHVCLAVAEYHDRDRVIEQSGPGERDRLVHFREFFDPDAGDIPGYLPTLCLFLQLGQRSRKLAFGVVVIRQIRRIARQQIAALRRFRVQQSFKHETSAQPGLPGVHDGAAYRDVPPRQRGGNHAGERQQREHSDGSQAGGRRCRPAADSPFQDVVRLDVRPRAGGEIGQIVVGVVRARLTHGPRLDQDVIVHRAGNRSDDLGMEIHDFARYKDVRVTRDLQRPTVVISCRRRNLSYPSVFHQCAAPRPPRGPRDFGDDGSIGR